MTTWISWHRAAAVVLWLVLATASVLPTQQLLTLGDALTLAQTRGHRARAAAATRDASRFRDRAFASRLLPQLSLAGVTPNYNRSIIPVLQPDGSTLFRTQQQTDATLGLVLSQKLPFTGGDLFVSSSLARLAVSGPQPIETWSSTPVQIGLRQELVRPNGTAWDRREQVLRTERDEREYKETLELIALETSDLFFDLYAARTGLENAIKNAAINDTLYRLNTGRFEVGRIGENDLLQSELALLRARTAVEGARLDEARAAAVLRTALDLPPGTRAEITVTTMVPEFDPDTARAVKEALANRAAMSDLELRDVQARRRVTEARLGNWIGASVQASLGFNGTAPRASLAYEELLEARRFSLTVQVPLIQWGARTETVLAAQSERERLANEAQATRNQTALDAHFAVLQLNQARRNVALFAKADTVADRRFEVAYNRYVIGRITIDNLYLAQAEKDQARTQFVQALRSYWRAHYQLRRLTLFDFETGRPIS